MPVEVATVLSHVLSGDPRPHYLHQSNLAEERIAYPVVGKVLESYRALFAANTPLVNERMSHLGEQLRRSAAWSAAVAEGTAGGYRQGDQIVLYAPPGVQVPVTVSGASPDLGEPYAGQRSSWRPAGALQVA